MVKDIKVGQKFLSNGFEVEIVCVTGKVPNYPVIDDYGMTYTKNGLLDHRVSDPRDLQPIPATIEEGVAFSGEQYRAEFERLTKEGRKFEYFSNELNRWMEKFDKTFFSETPYRLLPQHRDAVGNPLKVGDRVRVDGVDGTITRLDRDLVSTELMNFGAKSCRKLTTLTRPLCAADLEKAPHPMFRSSGHVFNADWSEYGVQVSVMSLLWTDLNDYEWRPSADHPWQPCEVTEEVPV